MNILDRIREKHHLSDTTPIGVASKFGKDANQTVDTQTRQVWVFANTDDVDLQQEVVVPAGADTGYFKANRNIFVDHKTDMESWVGKMRDMTPEPSSRMFKAWKVGIWVKKTELGDDILTMANEGGVGVSIGFIPLDCGAPNAGETKTYGDECRSIVRAWKWLELSFTPFPCNVNCQTQSVKYGQGSPEIIENLLVKGAIRKASAAAVGFPTKTSPSIRVLSWKKTPPIAVSK